jgi:hypothetical protein
MGNVSCLMGLVMGKLSRHMGPVMGKATRHMELVMGKVSLRPIFSTNLHLRLPLLVKPSSSYHLRFIAIRVTCLHATKAKVYFQ